MRKMFLSTILVAGFIFSGASAGHCWPWGKKAEEKKEAVVSEKVATKESVAPAPSVEPKKAPAASKADLSKIRTAREKKRKEINETQWPVETMPLSGKGAKQKDVLVFKENKFFSEGFAKLGFLPSNYTLSVQENGPIVVETMQTSDKEGVAFWRVEVDPTLASCKGVLSRQLSDGKGEDFSFISTGPKAPATIALPGAPVPAAAEAPVKEAAPAKETATEAEKSM